MRARQRRRRMVRRVTILATIIVVAISLGVGVYILSVANGPSAVDAYIGSPVTASDANALYKLAIGPYGPAPTTSMVNSVQSNGGSVLTSEGKPVVVYIGAEYCPYCAIQRWALVMGLMRFGNFSGLQYMTSRPGDVGAGDYATFTFSSSTYTSAFITFRPYEVEDRGFSTITTVPTNYSVPWTSAGSNFPYMNFANSYTVPGSMLASPQDLTGKNWTQVIHDISSNDATGLEIRESANMITALVCKLTDNRPESVCTQSPIAAQVSSLSSPLSGSLQLEPQPPAVAAVPASVSKSPGHSFI